MERGNEGGKINEPTLSIVSIYEYRGNYTDLFPLVAFPRGKISQSILSVSSFTIGRLQKYTHTNIYIYIRLEKEVTRERQIKSKHVCDQLTKHSVLMSILKFCNVYDKEFHRVFTGYYSKRILFDYSLSPLRVKEKKRISLSRIFHRVL